MAQSAAIATAFIIQQSGNITPEKGFGIAIYHYIEGTKTYPPEFSNETEKAINPKTAASENATPRDKSKSWWQFWK